MRRTQNINKSYKKIRKAIISYIKVGVKIYSVMTAVK